MPWEMWIWAISVALIVVLLSQRYWEDRLPGWLGRVRDVPWRWYLVGFPSTVVRIRWTWRKLCTNADLTVTNRPRQAVVGGDFLVKATALRPIPPRLGLPRATGNGLTVRVHLHPGQTPAPFMAASEALAHAWRVHSARVVSPRRGEVLITATARDPLADGAGRLPVRPVRVLAALVGRIENGAAWEIDFRQVPHWLVVGATQSGKSTLLAALVGQLAPQPVAVVGIDCKGGMELSLFEARLSALACNRREASGLLGGLVIEAEHRMAECRAAGVRSIWELGEDVRPVPIVILVDEIAELYLTDGSRDARQEAAECSTALLRLAQLGAALGLHLVVAGQRVGSELGPGVTALRAQLGGRICHRVNDEATAEMALGDLSPDAVMVAQSIGEDEQGVAVTTIGGHWLRARSTLTTTDQARRTAVLHAKNTPVLPGLVHAIGTGGSSA
ncbi:FtsK/SpoIIIE domain-containing protein [Streptomyces sp. SID13588]|uniref:FtsK/SpoIIIE domain-containing protein n=1 Tax=Streptomyces sp. SID13588 TaxID=2706051 RepID=UPI001EF22553|nr:FtsK/SpoIIIE domain-containing protein [Streptomyces sp. SID13588]